MAQEEVDSFKASSPKGERGFVSIHYSRQSAYVNQYLLLPSGQRLGPVFIKVSNYIPYPIKVCLNGHEWAKQQLRQARIGFEALNNGFLSCPDLATGKPSATSGGPEQIQAFFDKWIDRLPMPLTAKDRQVGYRRQLSVWQVKISRTQVFDDPQRGREFFEAVIRENLDLPLRPLMLGEKRH